ncbi:VOC family protein [Hymenobacter actinosclerus]|uniref:Glyoxalase-like domain-containing protein n=1 Tax=Hymenobacter actinosclerus TaxID=82805 RepID=A0A1I0J854_9BACT|nr:VOC family protein [Hymenobacter actinosclerus]SEU05992.1 Glyoxalase-like domain-containing protein [Hymenobacter actinosclerus]
MILNQVTVPALDVAKSVAFYQQLGLRLIVDACPRYARLECPDGEATFSVHQVTELPRGAGVMVYFEQERLDEWVAALQQQGITFDELPTDQSWLWREARLRDPAGNQLVLFYGGENRKNPPWRV